MVSAVSPSTDPTNRWQHPAPLSTALRSQTLLASLRIASAQIWLIATDQLVVPIQLKLQSQLMERSLMLVSDAAKLVLATATASSEAGF